MAKFVYFAHAMSDYHTQWEKDALTYIQEIFKEYTVLNPSGAHHQVKWQKEGMLYFDRYFMPKMDALVYTTFPNGDIGSGVVYEILNAKAAGIPVYLMHRALRTMVAIHSIGAIEANFIDRMETRDLIRRYKSG